MCRNIAVDFTICCLIMLMPCWFFFFICSNERALCWSVVVLVQFGDSYELGSIKFIPHILTGTLINDIRFLERTLPRIEVVIHDTVLNHLVLVAFYKLVEYLFIRHVGCGHLASEEDYVCSSCVTGSVTPGFIDAVEESSSLFLCRRIPC